MGESCSNCGVRDQSLCGSLTDLELAALSQLGRQRHYGRGEVVAWAGEEALICANVIAGVLKITASTADGREQIVGLLYPADFIGHPYAPSNDHTITALSAVELCVFPRRVFERELADHAAMERLLLQRTLAELVHSRDWMLLLGRKSAQERVASFLGDMARRLHTVPSNLPDAPEEMTFELPITRGEMADVLGLTIETVSRQMTKLKIAGIIDLPGARSVTVRKRGALAAFAEAA